MLEHIVLFEVKKTAPGEAAQAMLKALLNLKEKVKEIESLSCGLNFSDRAQGFTHGLVVRLKDKAALAVYRDHPEHQKVLTEKIRPICERVLAVDYEF